ncbi:uncharacterized protein LOC117213090 isoform X1 [Bombus bifarius]|uniref:Uncharacterized protein LOC117213090 isoform X1 n=2 Tax=Bombus bifarius TaxID=103933 RepID=A0A6P8N0R9_9HYME|nr:uncharacterized protein LOC117156280 isoform X1 [Bombus vancouverensis nearcticus]XP_033314278.1 uncharacterized protein LOC117213090 isoform X1 [Bombus bifarius]
MYTASILYHHSISEKLGISTMLYVSRMYLRVTEKLNQLTIKINHFVPENVSINKWRHKYILLNLYFMKLNTNKIKKCIKSGGEVWLLRSLYGRVHAIQWNAHTYHNSRRKYGITYVTSATINTSSMQETPVPPC